MAAIGDAEGTTTMLSLCPALYDQTLQPSEKEVMVTIFDREFRREKTLDVAKRLADKKAPKKETEDNEGAQKLEEKLSAIEEDFFKEVGDDEEERAMIKARGEANQAAVAEAEQAEAQYAGLLEGETYQFEGTRSTSDGPCPLAFAFTVEAGGSVHFQSPTGNVNGVIVGDKVTLAIKFDNDIQFEGVLADDCLTGTYTMGETTGTFSVD